jgi:hypothetical protein
MTSTVPRRPMTDAEVALARALARCSFPVASTPKRFAREVRAQVDHGAEITERQAAYLRRLVSIYRRQIPPASIPEAERYLLTDAAARSAREDGAADRWTAEPGKPVPFWVVLLTGMATVDRIIAKWGPGATFERPAAKPGAPRARAGRSVPPAPPPPAEAPAPDQLGLFAGEGR